ncbi:MAG: hypothetical protein KDA60_20500 [Planctomycetales bacterium]|nr:hypothetical protein [Planctomycetales bacterium]
MATSLHIVVSGLAGTYPLGGMFWHYVQFVQGLRRLGHEVLYVEDTGRWCYSPYNMTFVESARENATIIDRQLRRLDPELGMCWHYRDAADVVHGRSWDDVCHFCQSADLFINISASALLRDEYLACQRLVFVDTDPLYTQASIPDYVAGVIEPSLRLGVESLLRHDVFFTYGENVGREDCLVPRDLIAWHPIRQPLLLDAYRAHGIPCEARRRRLTTVGSWGPAESHTKVRGALYYGKSVEFSRFLELPVRSTLPLEVAWSGQAPIETMETHGWHIRDGHEVSRDPWDYWDYLARSWAEWSVAKQGYVASRCGWLSDRSASYLALGVPAIVQDTGASTPTDRGLIAFGTLDEAVSAIDRVATRPRLHSQAALEIAREYFGSDKVLSQMLEQVFAT